jgi:very-short-patch-repair endonuclease
VLNQLPAASVGTKVVTATMRKIFIRISARDSTLGGLWLKKKQREYKKRAKFKKKAVKTIAPKPRIKPFPSMPLLKERQQKLISNPTPAEIEFKSRLDAAGIEYIFQCITGFYIPDFIIKSNSVIVELDGPIHDAAKDYDGRRDRFLTSCGFHVLRIANSEAGRYPLDKVLSMSGSKPLGSCLSHANVKRGRVIAAMRATSGPNVDINNP